MKPVRLVLRGLSLASLLALLVLAAVAAQRRARPAPASLPASTAPASAPAPDLVFLAGSKSGPLRLEPGSRPAFLPSSKSGGLATELFLELPASRPDRQ